MNARDIPNAITLLRFLLVPPVVWLLLQGQYALALLVFAVAGLSDALDGYLAKRNGWTSRMGEILDPLADKTLLVSSYLVLGWLGQIPGWLVALVILRDLVILAGATLYHYRVQHVDAAPTLVSKLNTALQILLVLVVMLDAGLWSLPPLWLDTLIVMVLATTLWSGLDYVWTWGRRAWRHGKGQRSAR